MVEKKRPELSTFPDTRNYFAIDVLVALVHVLALKTKINES